MSVCLGGGCGGLGLIIGGLGGVLVLVRRRRLLWSLDRLRGRGERLGVSWTCDGSSMCAGCALGSGAGAISV